MKVLSFKNILKISRKKKQEIKTELNGVFFERRLTKIMNLLLYY